PEGTTEDAKKGPLALEVREPISTTLAKGIVTLVPAAHLESAKYDYGTQLVTLTVKGLKTPLTGTLEYKGINVLGISGMADVKSASFTCGVVGKGGVKSVTFAGAKEIPPPKATGTFWAVQINQPTAKDPT